MEAIDKKENFPKAPKRLSTAPASPPPASSPQAARTPNRDGDKGKKPEEVEKETLKVITPELRKLLSRDVEVLPRQEVRKKGDGFRS